MMSQRKEIAADHEEWLKKHSAKLKVLEEAMATKAKLTEFRVLEKSTKLLPTHSDIETLKKKIYDSIDAFHRQDETYQIQFNANCEMVARFDEVLSLKASKQSLDIFTAKIDLD